MVKRNDDSNSPHLSVEQWTGLRDRVSKDLLPEILARVVDIGLHGKDKEALAACNTVIGWYVGNVADESRRNTRSVINLLFTQAQLVDGQVVDTDGVDILDCTPPPPLLLDEDSKAAIQHTVSQTLGNDDSQFGA
jgi:hypothetical protein